ncbi:NAD(+) diphosphatase [Desulfomicrobium salsuginis]
MDHYSRSARNAFSGLILNRKPARPAADTAPSGREAYIIVRGDEILFDDRLGEPLLLSARMLEGCDCIRLETLLLGDDGETSYFAVSIDRLPERTAHCISGLGVFQPLRPRAASLEPHMTALLGYARSVASWHNQARFCSLCGHPTTPRPFSLAQACTNPACGMEHYPRVNPAMIVLVRHEDENGDRCLLGRQAGWKPRVYSAVSGYVEPGESAEDTVMREVLEETGIHVTDIRYFCSQPWPFSNSLMLGFHARATSTRIRLNDEELEDARWFARAEIPALLESGVLALPASETISRHLFDAWYEGRIPAP